jgi:hypothetical protein
MSNDDQSRFSLSELARLGQKPVGAAWVLLHKLGIPFDEATETADSDDFWNALDAAGELVEKTALAEERREETAEERRLLDEAEDAERTYLGSLNPIRSRQWIEDSLTDRGVKVVQRDLRNRARFKLKLPGGGHLHLITYVNLTPVPSGKPWVFTLGHLKKKRNRVAADWYAVIGYHMKTAVLMRRDEILERFDRKGVAETPDRATVTVHPAMLKTHSLAARLEELKAGDS